MLRYNQYGDKNGDGQWLSNFLVGQETILVGSAGKKTLVASETKCLIVVSAQYLDKETWLFHSADHSPSIIPYRKFHHTPRTVLFYP